MNHAKKTNLKSALRKLHYHNANVWCGCLTPSEILALIADGAKTVNGEHIVIYAQYKYKKGECNPMWFYCVPKTNPY